MVVVAPTDGEAELVVLLRDTVANAGLGYDPVKSPPALPDGAADMVMLPVPYAVPLMVCVVETFVVNA